MTPAEYAELKADIQAHGQQVPIVVIGTQIIDGRHRYQACKELEIAPKVIDAAGDPFLLVQSLNLRRRHLSADQIAAFYAKLRRDHPELQLKLRGIEVAARARQIAALKHGAAIPRRVPGNPTGKSGRTAAREAMEIGSTETAVKRVKQIEREHPESLPAIEAGTVTAKEVLRYDGAEPAIRAKQIGMKARAAAAKPTSTTSDARALLKDKALPGSTQRALQKVYDLVVDQLPHGATPPAMRQGIAEFLTELATLVRKEEIGFVLTGRRS
jgi:ParB-like chromosome segregation protein Spo0J